MPGLPPTRAALNARLDHLRSRLQALKEAFHDEGTRKSCDAELRDLRHISLLITHLHAPGSLRVISAMLDARTERIERLAGLLDRQGPRSKAAR